MKKKIVLLTALLFLIFGVSPASAIIGGNLDTEHTNVGAIVLEWPQQNYVLARLCSATLIREDVLISAAHCFTGLEEAGNGDEPLYVTFKQYAVLGDPEPEDFPDEYLPVEQYIYHPDYDPTLDDPHDIALVILEAPVDDMESEDIPYEGYLDDVIGEEKGRKDIPFTIVGYGAQEFYKDNVDRFLDAVRKYGTVSYKKLSPYLMVTYQDEEGGIICHGDSGGPIFFNDPLLGEKMVGINGVGSGWGWACSSDTTRHYRLDTDSAQGWIEDQLSTLK